MINLSFKNTFLLFQNRSNCKTVLYLRNPPTGHLLPSFNGSRGHAVSHRKTKCVFFKPWGSNLSEFFWIHFKGVRLVLLAPICNRKKANSTIFPLKASLPALDGGVDRLYSKTFSFLVRLSLPLLTQEPPSTLPVLPLRWGGDAPDVDLKASLPDIQLFTLNLACL